MPKPTQSIVHCCYTAALVIIAICLNKPLQAQEFPPSATIVSPYNNSYFEKDSDITIKVYSTDIGKSEQNGTITIVEFFADGEKLGEATEGKQNTYSFVWQNVPAGTYILTAKATNDNNISFTSVGSIITVGEESNSGLGLSACKGKTISNIIGNKPSDNYNTYWNGISPEIAGIWGAVESTRDTYNWSGVDYIYSHAEENNMLFTYYNIIYSNSYPSWFYGISTSDIRAEVIEYMEGIAKKYPLTDNVIVLSEMLYNHSHNNQFFRDIFSGTENCPIDDYSWQIWLFEEARKIFPNTKLLLDDFGFFSADSIIDVQLNVIKELRDRGLIDGFGLEAHYLEIDTATKETLKNTLDKISKAGIPIYITAYTSKGEQPTDEKQLESYQRCFPVFWEHPAVANISIMGYEVGKTWTEGIHLLNEDGSERPAMTWLKEYISSQPDKGYPMCSFEYTEPCNVEPPQLEADTYYFNYQGIAEELFVSGDSIKWYDSETATTPLEKAPTPSTENPGVTTYYVSQTNGCESKRVPIYVIIMGPDDPTIEIISVDTALSYYTNETIFVRTNVFSPHLLDLSVTFYVDGELQGTDTSDPFEIELSELSEGTHTIVASIEDEHGLTNADTVTIMVKLPDVSFRMKKGWNLIGYADKNTVSIEDRFSENSNKILIVKDDKGFWDSSIPEHLHSLTTLEFGKGYFIKVSEDFELIWESKK